MNKIFKSIGVVVCAMVVNNALADQPAQSAMNRNGSSEVIAQLRCSWKNACAKPIATTLQKQRPVRGKGKGRSVIAKTKPAMSR